MIKVLEAVDIKLMGTVIHIVAQLESVTVVPVIMVEVEIAVATFVEVLDELESRVLESW